MGEQIASRSYFYSMDHLGSIRELTDGAGAVRARYDFGLWGDRTKLAGDMDADFGFTGLHWHEASGQDLTFFRAYQPTLGRWTSRDPLGENAGLNLYSYVGNMPPLFVDRLGLAWRTPDATFLKYAAEGDVNSIEELLVNVEGVSPEAARPLAQQMVRNALIRNQTLTNIMKSLFRLENLLPGGTAAKLLEEVAQGDCGHLQKAQDYFKALTNLLVYHSSELSEAERAIAVQVRNELRAAIEAAEALLNR